MKPLFQKQTSAAGLTLVEVVVALSIIGLAAVGIIDAYILAAKRSEWSAYSLAANSLAMQRMEQCRAAKWDPTSFPPRDFLIAGNFPPLVEILDVPVRGTNSVLATNFTLIEFVSNDPPLKKIRVDCVWRFMEGTLQTNRVTTYRAPDQ